MPFIILSENRLGIVSRLCLLEDRGLVKDMVRPVAGFAQNKEALHDNSGRR